jgi:hypothetical protein
MTEQKKPTIAKLSKAQKKKAMVRAIHQTLGNVTASTRAVGIDRKTHYLWMEQDEKYRLACEEAVEIDLDFSEAALRKNIQNGKEASIIFHLKTKGKHRGYIETQHNLNTEITKNDMKEKSVEELLRIIEGDD